jgi:hypothetical protein
MKAILISIDFRDYITTDADQATEFVQFLEELGFEVLTKVEHVQCAMSLQVC